MSDGDAKDIKYKSGCKVEHSSTFAESNENIQIKCGYGMKTIDRKSRKELSECLHGASVVYKLTGEVH